MLLADLLRILGLHVPQRLRTTQPPLGVESSSLWVSRHHVGVHVRRGLVPVDAGIDHVFRAMATFFSQSSASRKYASCSSRLLLAMAFRAGRHQVLDSLDSILPEALRQSRPERGHAFRHAMRAEMLVVVRQLGGCVRRVLRSEAVLHGAMDSDRGLELLHSSELRNVPLRHSATFCEKWTHYTLLRKVVSPCGLWGAASPPPS